MHIILIPGLWLDASTWDDVVPALEAAGHTSHPLTMPGLGEPAERSADIGIADWVAAVVAEIDRLPDPVVLVGHSGGGNVAWGAADARPDRAARIVFVDTFPPGDGGSIWEFPVVEGVVPFPGWDAFEDAEVGDLDDRTRAAAASRARSVPARIPTDAISLTDPRRYAIPVTMLTGTMPAADLHATIAQAPPWAADLAALQAVTIVELNSGHWPQFSQPAELGRAIAAALV
ncbi:alpha/beta fold hydrolase [Microbacterium lushaniae]|uniref:Alpha/beta hydrolase n=1 Tax=Microbacterium lushaniae TaxID=2614639 RepID=A0A5J6L366_9MICO|nr:alpha/beta hydrolase [Microbacterium lushaniae]QEW02974.1 alpha/beta hydrolase [Microbacterium lushaniae]